MLRYFRTSCSVAPLGPARSQGTGFLPMPTGIPSLPEGSPTNSRHCCSELLVDARSLHRGCPILLLPSTSVYCSANTDSHNLWYSSAFQTKKTQEFLTILRPAGEEALGNLKNRDRWTWLQNLALLGCPSRLYQPGGGCCLRAFWQEEMRPWTWCKAGPGRRRVVRGAKCQFELVEHYCS